MSKANYTGKLTMDSLEVGSYLYMDESQLADARSC